MAYGLVDPATGNMPPENVGSFSFRREKADRSVQKTAIENRKEDAQPRNKNKSPITADIEANMEVEALDGNAIPAFSMERILPVGAVIITET
jgi:hypothetical protein